MEARVYRCQTQRLGDAQASRSGSPRRFVQFSTMASLRETPRDVDERAEGPDPVVDSDRLSGTTAPESGAEGENVVGRPAVERPLTAVHQKTETPETEAEPFNEREALERGGSFQGIAPLQDLGNGSD